jgi:hypothetical protein
MIRAYGLYAAIVGVALVVGAAPLARAKPSFPSSAAGDWMGTVGSKVARRHVFIHIHETLSGGYVGTMDSPEGSAASIGIEPVAASGDTLAFSGGGAEFRGQWNNAHGQWEGTWTDADGDWPVSLRYEVRDTGSRIVSKPVPTFSVPFESH